VDFFQQPEDARRPPQHDPTSNFILNAHTMPTTTILAITLCLLGAAFAENFNDIPYRLQGASPDAIKAILKMLNRGETFKGKRGDPEQLFKNYLTGSNNDFGFFNDVTVLRAKEIREQLKAMLGKTDSLDITRVNPIETVITTLPVVQQVSGVKLAFLCHRDIYV
jgi:hypothetical protein